MWGEQGRTEVRMGAGNLPKDRGLNGEPRGLGKGKQRSQEEMWVLGQDRLWRAEVYGALSVKFLGFCPGCSLTGGSDFRAV